MSNHAVEPSAISVKVVAVIGKESPVRTRRPLAPAANPPTISPRAPRTLSRSAATCAACHAAS